MAGARPKARWAAATSLGATPEAGASSRSYVDLMNKTPAEDLVELSALTEAMASHFQGGPVTLRELHRTAEAHPVQVAVVRFEHGARNHWHRHAGGQLLYFIEGEGVVQSRGEAPLHVEPGDSVSAAAGEEHWHGAAPGRSMAHIAVNVGETTWLEPVS